LAPYRGQKYLRGSELLSKRLRNHPYKTSSSDPWPEFFVGTSSPGAIPMSIIRRSLAALSMLAAVTLISPSVQAASTPTRPTLLQVSGGKAKIVQLSLHNNFSSPVELRAGDTVITLAPGKTMSVKLPAGTRIVTNSDTGKLKSGDLLIEVLASFNGATISVN
jgi:hypothetical protein